MKRRTLKFIACAAVMALTLSVTACGGGSDDSKSTPAVEDTNTQADVSAPEADEEKEEEVNKAEEEETETPEAEEPETEEEEEEEASADFETLEELFNDPDLQEMYDSLLDAMSEEGISLSYEVSGNDFIMIFTITDSSLATDEMAEALTDALETQGDQFKTQASQFDSLLEGKGTCTVTIRYTDPDGKVMAEKTFTAD